MLRALLLIAVLAIAAACNPAASPSPTLSLQSPAGGGLESPAASTGTGIESPAASMGLESTGTGLESPAASQ